MKLRCNVCLGEYSDTQRDGAGYHHACSPEVIQHAAFDAQGKQLTPEVRTPRPGARDENVKFDASEVTQI